MDDRDPVAQNAEIPPHPVKSGMGIGAGQPVETVCCLYHQKKDFISVPYEPKDADYMNQLK